MSKAIVLFCIVVACGLSLIEAQQDCPTEGRATCGDGTGCNTTRCCYDPTKPPHCFARTRVADVASLIAEANQILGVVSRPDNLEPVIEEARSLGADIGDQASDVQSRAINFPIQNLINFPACPINVPFCHRTRCAAHIPNAEHDALACFSDRRCCFDKDLYFHKFIFGANYMGGAPVCYYGPTSSSYIQIANGINPWNPFYMQAVVNIFEGVLDAYFNFRQNTICSLTNLFNIPLFRNSKCGWKGITKSECSLKGCCYNDDSSECVYPRQDLPLNFGVLGQSFELYPELNTHLPEETTCRNLYDFSFDPNLYRRLPCSCPEGTETIQSILLNCPSGGCCANYLALIPQLADITAIGSPVATTGNALLPFILGGGLPTGFSISQFYCPFFYLPVPGLPPLFDRIGECCKQHSCYHKKRLVSSWGGWSSWRCNVQCGSGTETRSRTCSSGSSCVGRSVETRPCNLAACSFWANWGPFGGCSATCGNTGLHSRSRQCFGGGACVGQSFQQAPCNRVICASWTLWQNWGSCSQPCGPSGQRTRQRFCQSNGQPRNSCPSGFGIQRASCNRFSCGTWGAWSFSGPCSGPCGTTGSRPRSRSCLRNGQPVTGCPGSSTGQISCTNPPCQWSVWGSWEPCQASCTRTRTRSCPAGQCPGSTPTETETCINGGCTIDPVPDAISWDAWSQWTACDPPCSGQRHRIRRCIYNGQANAIVPNQACECTVGGTYLDQESCQVNACSANWGVWGEWSACPCGSGQTRVRTRSCMLNGQTVNNGQCTGSASESEDCYSGACSTWTNWTKWSVCQCLNGAGSQIRARCIDTLVDCGGDRLEIERGSCSRTC